MTFLAWLRHLVVWQTATYVSKPIRQRFSHITERAIILSENRYGEWSARTDRRG